MNCIILLAGLFFGAVGTLVLHWTDFFSWDHKPDKNKPTVAYDMAMGWWRWILCMLCSSLLVTPFVYCAILNDPLPLLGCLFFPFAWLFRDIGDSLIKQWFLKHDIKLLELACHKLKEPNKHSWHGFSDDEVIKALYSLGLGDEIDERRYKASLSFHCFDESAIKKRMSHWCRTGAWALNE